MTVTLAEPTFGETCIQPDTGCKRCGAELTGRRTTWCSDACRDIWYANHRWTQAREEAMRRAHHRCVRCHDRAVEVDHIIERQGQPLGVNSCLHHQANLRPLCHECHRTRRLWEAA
ncbi:MAG: HNH endonuclease [Mycobacteriaceae bacterium]